MTTAAEFFAGREDSARLFETLRSAIEEFATLAEVDDEVRAWLREAWDEAA